MWPESTRPILSRAFRANIPTTKSYTGNNATILITTFVIYD